MTRFRRARRGRRWDDVAAWLAAQFVVMFPPATPPRPRPEPVRRPAGPPPGSPVLTAADIAAALAELEGRYPVPPPVGRHAADGAPPADPATVEVVVARHSDTETAVRTRAAEDEEMWRRRRRLEQLAAERQHAAEVHAAEVHAAEVRAEEVRAEQARAAHVAPDVVPG